MSAVIADILWHPLVPLWFVVAILAAAAGLIAIAVFRRTRGSLFRALAMAALGIAVLDPRVVHEDQRPRPDVALLVVDDSPSDQIGDRAHMIETARARIEASLGKLDGLEIRTIHAGADGTGETRLFGAIERAVLDDLSDRLAGVLILSDGQVHDVPPPGSAPWLTAPVHLLVAGKRDEHDRRVVIEQAPAYGLVDERVTVSYRIEEAGTPPATNSPVRVRFRVDGVDAGHAEAIPGRTASYALPIRHVGPTVLEIEADPAPDDVSTLNNRAATVVKGVRDRLRVLLVSGQPHPGERTWRNLLKSDPSVDLIHFTILRPPEKDDSTPLKDLSLIVFPVQELFETKLYDFDLIVLDRYVVRGILPMPYYGRIAEYVRQGGALLVSVGPEFAGPQSLYSTPLGDVLPIAPDGRIIDKAFRPEVSDVGHRHPVTAALPGEGQTNNDGGAAPSGPSWGRWFRLIGGEARTGTTLMTGDDGQPLLAVARVGDGRVAQLMSDQIWLWSRGYDGGGPHAELLRRLAHWLMKEPDLEEERLAVQASDGILTVTRRSLEAGDVDVTVTDPAGVDHPLHLESGVDGVSRAQMRADATGLWRVSDGTHTALTAVGRINPPEFVDLRASAERLAPLVTATGGGIAWLADGIPEFRRTEPGRDAAGRGWLGLQRNRAHATVGATEVPLMPVLILAVILGGLASAWWRESR
ncbi:MAG: hypothetical protein IPK66_00795 [Rhodospirillales bacterium]|nr:hypothetical protein [Rhodospirillales bacterium]